MKQIQIAFNGKEKFLSELEQFRQKWDNAPQIIFQIFSEIIDEEPIKEVIGIIEQVFPETPWFGCSSCGNLVDCKLFSDIVVVATVFEKESSRIKVVQYPTREKPIEWITNKILEETETNQWIKAIELYFTIPEESTTKFSEGLKNINPDIHIFGGVAGNDDITSDVSYVFSNDGGISQHSILAVFYGGDDFYVDSIKITGWKPLGRRFRVTKAEGTTLYELDGVPAYDIYHKYLSMNNDENFFYNTLEFPLLYEWNGIIILRVPMASNPDHSISVSADIEVGSTVRIAYGDPKTIIESVAEDSWHIKKFCPDVLHFFSCVARRTFWTSTQPTYELEPFKDIAPSVGFYSLGEFLRADSCLSHHNVTLVIAAMREGEAELPEVELPEHKTSRSKLPLVSRLATFISATSLELEEMNQKLISAAITDGLTGLFNRTETQRRIDNCLANIKNEQLSLIMMDIDNFKQVNDTYGHQEGDSVIVALANILLAEQKRVSGKIFAGRWGGEEFMMVLSNTDLSTATLIADLIRQCFENTRFPSIRHAQTISVGVTQATPEDTSDSLCSRVDEALYRAKKTGKNKVVVL